MLKKNCIDFISELSLIRGHFIDILGSVDKKYNFNYKEIKNNLKELESISVELKSKPADYKKIDILSLRIEKVKDNTAQYIENNTLEKYVYQKRTTINMSLIAMIGICESYFSNLLHSYLKKYPLSLGKEFFADKSFSLDDLEKFNNINDVKEYRISKYVEAIVRGNVGSWIDFLDKKHKVNNTFIKENNKKLILIYQYRNIIVHNNGIINNIFLSLIPEEFKENYKIGDILKISISSFYQYLDILESFFISITYELFKKSNKDIKNHETFLKTLFKYYIDNQRSSINLYLSQFSFNDKKFSKDFQEESLMYFFYSMYKAGNKRFFDDEITKSGLFRRSKGLRKVYVLIITRAEKSSILRTCEKMILDGELKIEDAKNDSILMDYFHSEDIKKIVKKKTSKKATKKKTAKKVTKKKTSKKVTKKKTSKKA